MSTWWFLRIIHHFKNIACLSLPLPLDDASHFQVQVNHNMTDDNYIWL